MNVLMYQIEELPDLKASWHESYKCLNEPLLEYVWWKIQCKLPPKTKRFCPLVLK